MDGATDIGLGRDSGGGSRRRGGGNDVSRGRVLKGQGQRSGGEQKHGEGPSADRRALSGRPGPLTVPDGHDVS